MTIRNQQFGWTGVDLDGTIAYYDHWRGEDHVGQPIAAMVERVKQWLTEGREVRIFTARVDGLFFKDTPADDAACVQPIRDWCQLVFGAVLPITNRKDYGMTHLYDDRAVQVVHNEGRLVCL